MTEKVKQKKWWMSKGKKYFINELRKTKKQ